MCSSPHTCEVLGDYLNTLDRRKSRDVWGRRMMERRLRRYLWWKSKLNSADKSEKGTKPVQGTPKLVRGEPNQGQDVQSRATWPSAAPPREREDTKEDGRNGGEERELMAGDSQFPNGEVE